MHQTDTLDNESRMTIGALCRKGYTTTVSASVRPKPPLVDGMRGLSLTQPWASLVALRHKRIETRSWSTKYRGPLYIHASKGFPRDAKEFAEEERALGRLPERLPLGCFVATVRLVDVQRTEDVNLTISGLERHLGDYSPSRFAWLFEDIVPFAEPIPWKGSLGLFKVNLYNWHKLCLYEGCECECGHSKG